MQTRLCYSSTLNLLRASLFTHEESQRPWPRYLMWSVSTLTLRSHFCFPLTQPATVLPASLCSSNAPRTSAPWDLCPCGTICSYVLSTSCTSCLFFIYTSSSHHLIRMAFPDRSSSHSLFIHPLLFAIALITT